MYWAALGTLDPGIGDLPVHGFSLAGSVGLGIRRSMFVMGRVMIGKVGIPSNAHRIWMNA
jgi:hypothetical protein